MQSAGDAGPSGSDHLHATRAAYDTIAGDYADRFRDELAGKPFGRAMLDAFAELVRGPVADLGCGPGQTTAYLHARGVDVFGIDLSPAMVEVARRTHPAMRFDVGSMTALGLADGSLGGVVAWYSIIHLPPDGLPEVFAEFRRVLAPGGLLLLAFQVGEEPLRIEEAFGHRISLDFHRRRPDLVVELLTAAGFVVEARLERAADETERSPQAHVLARRPATQMVASPSP